jgi:hypothetical protein
MANVKVFADKQTIQKLYAPDLLIRRQHKNAVRTLPLEYMKWKSEQEEANN